MAAHKVVLAVQDSTSLNYTAHALSTEGLALLELRLRRGGTATSRYPATGCASTFSQSFSARHRAPAR